MQVDVSKASQQIDINLDIDLPYIPCHIVSLDVQDVVGTHIVDFGGELNKVRLDSSGNEIETWTSKQKHFDNAENIQGAKQAYAAKEGCKLQGNVRINKISGNFHISSHSYSNTAQQLLLSGAKIDFSHRINHLSFGDESSIKTVSRSVSVKNVAPLDKHQQLTPTQAQNQAHMHNSFTTYYMTVTPAQYNINGEDFMVHEFTHSEQTVMSHHYPAIFFRFQLSPVFVSYEISSVTFFSYFIRLCSIIGGVYTMAGMLEGIWHSLWEKKDEHDN